METLSKFIEKINTEEKFSGVLHYERPMSFHTSFKIGGNADVYLRPDKDIFLDYSRKLLLEAKKEGIPVFILGAGANILVSDKGIRGIVLDTGSYEGIIGEIKQPSGEETIEVKVLSGTGVDAFVDKLSSFSLSGMEFLAGMPGSIGGAVWMNARCYGKSISDVLLETEILDEEFRIKTIPALKEDFDYKKSPFQAKENLILSASFSLQHADRGDILDLMGFNRQDRREKGHFRHPSAGSAFKNNGDFGEPTGKIIDDLGLKGFSIGGAMVSPLHGNIVFNTGDAGAIDVKKLLDEVARRVKEERGFTLESEILFIGEW
ncbi:MAG: UDP-N-acetylmuramate dehydrogenase [Treponema sp.]|nr:UDP-N-acetylmuramate dehydrogenase [Treponema sp.]